MTEEKIRYSVPKKNFEKLCKKLEKVAKKCESRGVPFSMSIVGEEVRQEEYGPLNRYGNSCCRR